MNSSSRDLSRAASVKLTENQREVLGNAEGAARTNPGEWLRPMDMGGTDGSHHGATAARLAAKGLLERFDGLSMGRCRPVYRYRITEAGRAAASKATGETGQ